MDKRAIINQLGKSQCIAVAILFSCIALIFMASVASAQEEKKERGYNGRITIQELLSKFKRGEIVEGYIIDGGDIIKIIRTTRYAIEIVDSIIEDGLDFTKLPKIRLDKIKLPRDWDKEKRDAVVKERGTFAYQFIHDVKNKIQIVNSEIQSKKKNIPSVQAKGTIFYNGVNFCGTTFIGETNFSNATFSEWARFDYATFSGRSSFLVATFSGAVAFVSAIFSELSDFSSATFCGFVNFSKTTFCGEANLSDVTFNGAYFCGTTFSGKANFSKATFIGGVAFLSAIFSELSDFSSATFYKSTSFTGTTFSKMVRFSNTAFSGWAGFLHATFHDLTYFRRSKVDTLVLDNTLFTNYTDFREMAIGKLQYECSSRRIVKGRVDFRNSSISEMHFQDIIFENDVDFSDVKFGIPLDEKPDGKLATVFRYVTFESDVDFIRTEFHSNAAFERIKCKGDANFTDIAFKNFKGEDTKNISLSYLTFKHLLLSMGDLPDIQYWVRGNKDTISDFHEGEFLPPFTVERLCEAINKDNYDIFLESPNNTIEWLNELLSIPHFYDVHRKIKPDSKLPDSIMKLIEGTESYRKKDFKDLREDEMNSIITLNRLILEVTYPQKTPKMQESLQPLTKVLNNLEDVFHSQNNLSDANMAYYYRKLIELEDTRKKGPFCLWTWKWVEWIFWGLPCGYAISLWRIVSVCGGFYLFFVILYSTGGNLTKTYQEKEDEFRLRLFVLPRKYLFHENDGDYIPNEYLKGWGKFIDALKLSMVIFFKIGYLDTKISGKISQICVWVEWVIGYWLLTALVVTLSNTLPIVHRLISGIF